jgi:hypothetical protein
MRPTDAGAPKANTGKPPPMRPVEPPKDGSDRITDISDDDAALDAYSTVVTRVAATVGPSVAAAGHPVATSQDLQQLMLADAIGRDVQITVSRNGAMVDVIAVPQELTPA